MRSVSLCTAFIEQFAVRRLTGQSLPRPGRRTDLGLRILREEGQSGDASRTAERFACVQSALQYSRSVSAGEIWTDKLFCETIFRRSRTASAACHSVRSVREARSIFLQMRSSTALQRTILSYHPGSPGAGSLSCPTSSVTARICLMFIERRYP